MKLFSASLLAAALLAGCGGMAPKMAADTPTRTADGVLWIGTYGRGASWLAPPLFAHYGKIPDDDNSLAAAAAFQVYQDPAGIVWVGTDGGGLDRLDPTTGAFRHYRHDPDDPTSISSDQVWSTRKDRNGNYWVGTFDGLNLLDPVSGKFQHFRKVPGDSSSLGGDIVFAIGAVFLAVYALKLLGRPPREEKVPAGQPHGAD